MTPTQAIARGFSLINWLAEHLNGLPVLASPRNQLSAVCLSVAQDHHTAVIVLLERELYASAFTLVRPLYEAYVKGVWLANCATESQVQRFARIGDAPPISGQIAALEKIEAFREGNLTRIHVESWAAMCSFTHTGILQVERWLTGKAIEQTFQPEDLIQAANFTGAIALMSGIGMATLAARSSLAELILERAREHSQNDS